MEEEIEEYINFDPSRDEVLGVFGNNVHVRGVKFLGEEDSEIVLIIPRKEYLRVWNNWLDGKKSKCEAYQHYCGVMGYTFPVDYIKQDYQIDLTVFDETKDVDDPDFVGSINVDVYKVTKFDDYHDFEHG